MNTIALVNTSLCPCLGTHRPACLEFIEGFTEFGYTTSEATSLEGCKDKTILLLSSHSINIDYLHSLNLLNPEAIYILWYYHSILDKIPFKKFILTGEYFYKPPRLEDHIKFHMINSSINNFVPLLLRANETPEMIGHYIRRASINGCFMGTPYKEEWIKGLPNIVYHNIHNMGLLSYEERKQIYLKSKIAFGFSCNENILNYHPTQRIFEGLTYGCVVISDSDVASEMTGGIVEYVKSYEEFIERYHYFLEHPEECSKKMELGYEWSKKYGTNRYSASLFLDKIRELWH
jgi:hypothetical protein